MAIVGHSERRLFGESDQLVARKFAAQAQGLVPILRRGVTASRGDACHQARQLDAVLELRGAAPSAAVLAHEPN